MPYPTPRTVRRALGVLESLPAEALADLAERLIDRVDALGPDPDLEEEQDCCGADDDHPARAMFGAGADWSAGSAEDAEEDDPGEEDDPQGDHRHDPDREGASAPVTGPAEGSPFQPDGAAWIGGDAIVENLFMRLATEWEGFTIHPERFHDAGETVVVEGRYTGTYIATGVSADQQCCHVFTFENGKLARFQQFTDTAQLQKTMGL